ncbi:hypothetical protein DL95DRAFT_410275 [Leptodontidium sp. 2 PMI_412]|nr:hypothetical protein DL95DRAFT_410275 [Leptodontidium sp. 2 PMI_412]
MTTPYTCKLMRKLILKAAIKLSADHEVNEYVKKGLIKSLEFEKKKRKRGKKMNLVGNETNGCELYRPVEISEARAFQQEKEEKVTQEKEDKITKKSEANARNTSIRSAVSRCVDYRRNYVRGLDSHNFTTPNLQDKLGDHVMIACDLIEELCFASSADADAAVLALNGVGVHSPLLAGMRDTSPIVCDQRLRAD